jgi:hypothetical protein
VARKTEREIIEMQKLVLFGDSLFGRCNKDLIDQLEATLSESYDIYNCAAGGWDSDDVLKKIT